MEQIIQTKTKYLQNLKTSEPRKMTDGRQPLSITWRSVPAALPQLWADTTYKQETWKPYMYDQQIITILDELEKVTSLQNGKALENIRPIYISTWKLSTQITKFVQQQQHTHTHTYTHQEKH
jgi:hypothetical protein